MIGYAERSHSADWERTFSVGDRYRCTLTIVAGRNGTPAAVRVEWDPATPHHLSRFEINEYLRQRDAFLADFHRETGLGVAVITI